LRRSTYERLQRPGEKPCVIVVGAEITERKLAEEKLVESQQQLQLFIEHAPAALAMFDDKMRYLHVSRRWMADFGLGDRDLFGLSHYDVFPEVPERWKDAHRRGLAGEVMRGEADPFERIDGSVQWVRWEIRPWEDAEGKVGGIVIFCEDITERRQAEELLRLNVERLRLAQDVAGMAIFDVEFPSGKRTWSPRSFQIFGLDPDHPQPQAEDLLRMCHPDDRSMVAERLQSVSKLRRIYVGRRSSYAHLPLDCRLPPRESVSESREIYMTNWDRH
jgi:PAS domain S-box-containing protein